MSNRTDNQGWNVRVTHLGNGAYGVRVLHNGLVYSQGSVKNKRGISALKTELLRWVAKLGNDSPMADASRKRIKPNEGA